MDDNSRETKISCGLQVSPRSFSFFHLVRVSAFRNGSLTIILEGGPPKNLPSFCSPRYVTFFLTSSLPPEAHEPPDPSCSKCFHLQGTLRSGGKSYTTSSYCGTLNMCIKIICPGCLPGISSRICT